MRKQKASRSAGQWASAFAQSVRKLSLTHFLTFSLSLLALCTTSARAGTGQWLYGTNTYANANGAFGLPITFQSLSNVVLPNGGRMVRAPITIKTVEGGSIGSNFLVAGPYNVICPDRTFSITVGNDDTARDWLTLTTNVFNYPSNFFASVPGIAQGTNMHLTTNAQGVVTVNNPGATGGSGSAFSINTNTTIISTNPTVIVFNAGNGVGWSVSSNNGVVTIQAHLNNITNSWALRSEALTNNDTRSLTFGTVSISALMLPSNSDGILAANLSGAIDAAQYGTGLGYDGNTRTLSLSAPLVNLHSTASNNADYASSISTLQSRANAIDSRALSNAAAFQPASAVLSDLAINGSNNVTKVNVQNGAANALTVTNPIIAGTLTFSNGVAIFTDNLTTGQIVRAQFILVTNAGVRVGIGTATPLAILDISNAPTATSAAILRAGTNNTGNGLTVTSNGNVLVGATASFGNNAGGVLHVAGAAYIANELRMGSSAFGVRLLSPSADKFGIANNQSPPGDLGFMWGNSESDLFPMFYRTNGSGHLYFMGAAGSGATNNLLIRGSVGIGTIATVEKLTVHGNVRITNGVLELAQVSTTNAPFTDSARLFAANVSGTAELIAEDENSNVNQLTSHPLHAPPNFYVVTNWTRMLPKISFTVNRYLGMVEWNNETLAALLRKWELRGTNISTLPVGVRLILSRALQEEETFDEYNTRLGYTNGHPERLVQWTWTDVQALRQLTYDTARTNELISFNTPLEVPTVTNVVNGAEQIVIGYTNAVNTNIVVRAARDIRKPVPAWLVQRLN